MSGEDAEGLGIAEGDIIEVESQSGIVQKPVSIKEGPREGGARIPCLQGSAAGPQAFRLTREVDRSKGAQRVK